MRQLHIAIFNLQGNADIFPTLGVCSELVKQGHQVTYACTAQYHRKISETGAKPITYELPSLGPADRFHQLPAANDPKFWEAFASIICPLWILHTLAELAQLESYYRENRPDLVLYGRFSFGGKILASRLRVPAGQLAPHFAVYRNLLIREGNSYINPEPMLVFGELLDVFMSSQGVESKGNLWLAEDLNICFIPRAFQMHGDSFENTFHFVGPCLNRPRQATWINKAPETPLILASGSQWDQGAKYFRTLIAALADSDFRVVLSLGGNVAEASLGAIPRNFEVNRAAYNIDILSHASLTICQSGMGTVMESLNFGVPVLAVPRSPGHAEVGFRVAELGLGKCVREDELTPERVRRSVDDILAEPSMKGRLRDMQDCVRASGGALAAADHIERYMKL